MKTQAKVAVQTRMQTNTKMHTIAFAGFVYLAVILIAGHVHAASQDAAHIAPPATSVSST